MCRIVPSSKQDSINCRRNVFDDDVIHDDNNVIQWLLSTNHYSIFYDITKSKIEHNDIDRTSVQLMATLVDYCLQYAKAHIGMSHDFLRMLVQLSPLEVDRMTIEIVPNARRSRIIDSSYPYTIVVYWAVADRQCSDVWYSSTILSIYHNQLVGRFYDFYDSHRLSDLGHFKDGKRTGRWQTWYHTGQIFINRYFIDGLLTGCYRRWACNGELISIGKYELGKKTGYWTTWNNGENFILEGIPIDDIGDELYQCKFASFPDICICGNYKDGKRIGCWTVKNRAGDIIKTIYYDQE